MTAISPAPPAPAAGQAGRRLRRTALTLGKVLLVAVPVVLWAPQLAHRGGPASTADPLARFLVATTVIILLCHLLGSLFERFGQTPVTGELVGGLLLGPSALGWAFPSAEHWLLPTAVTSALGMAAQLGLVTLMFLLGAELQRVERGPGSAKAVAGGVLGGMGLPFIAGCALAVAATHELRGTAGSKTGFVLFFGLALSITALPVLARVLVDLRLDRTALGAYAMTTAAVGDGTAWFVLTGILVFADHGSGSLAGALGVAASLVLATLLLVRPALRALERWAERSPEVERLAPALLLVGAIGYAAVTQLAGLDAVIGAFLFGTALPARSKIVERVGPRLQGFTLAVLLPMFFVQVGLDVSLRSLGTDTRGWLTAAAVLVVAIVTKLLGAGGSARLIGGLGARDALRFGLMMNCRGVTELVVAGIGYQQHLINTAGLTVLALVAVVTSIMTPTALKALMKSDADDDASAAPDAPAVSPEPQPAGAS